MARPGTTITLGTTPSDVSLPSNTGTAFMVGLAERGSAIKALPIQSLNDFITLFGSRQSYSVLYDAVEAFFREGGDIAYIGRVVGPGATLGTHNLLDAGAAVSLTVNAKGPGSWSANYKVAVVAGNAAGSYHIQITDLAGNVLEESGDLLDQASAVYWSQYSQYVDIVLGVATDNPAVAAGVVLSAGTSDRPNITDAQWLTAINLFLPTMGPGQLLAPGETSDARHTQLVTACLDGSRVALLDAPNTGTLATIEASASIEAGSKFAAMFWPWIVIPGLTTTTFRTVPPSPIVAGIIARNDPTLGTNRPSAGNAGVSTYGLDLSQNDLVDSDRQTLNGDGINVIRRMFGGIRIYGWRSLANPVSDSNWIPFSNSRLYMKLSNELDNVAENYVFDEIDGLNGKTINSFAADLKGVCLQHYNNGELFGDTAEEAFSVDVGSDVNTPVTLQNNELHAQVNVRMSPFAEWVQITIVKRQITETV